MLFLIQFIQFVCLSLSSDETTAVNQSGLITQLTTTDQDGYGGWKRPRSESSVDADSVYNTNAIISEAGYAQQSRRSSVNLTNN